MGAGVSATPTSHAAGTPVINLGAVVDRRGDYPGRRRHRLPYGCDPEGWPDGLVFWSKSAARWMRVAGYADEPLP